MKNVASQYYVGPRAFDEQDAEQDRFHGRRRERDDLVQRVTHRPLTLLYGRSGMGKTSLIQAGLAPELRRRGFVPIYLRVTRLLNRANSDDPFFAYVRREMIDQVQERGDLSIDEDAEASGLWEYLHAVPIWDVDGEPQVPVLVFDQFEELFRRTVPTELRKHVIASLADLIEEHAHIGREHEDADPYLREAGRPPCRVVIAIRQEFVAEIELLRQQIPSSAHNRMRVGYLSRESAREAVLGPTEESGIVSSKTADAIIDQCRRDAREPIEVEPFLLSLLCSELDTRRGDSAQIRAEDVENARASIVGDYVDSSFAQFTAPIGSAAFSARAFIEDELVDRDDGSRRLVRLTDFRKLVPKAAIVLERMEGRRILRTEKIEEIDYVEVVHDRIAQALHDSGATRRAQEAVRLAARRRMRKWQIAAAALVIIGGAVAGYALHVRGLNEELRQKKHALETRNQQLDVARTEVSDKNQKLEKQTGDLEKAYSTLTAKNEALERSEAKGAALSLDYLAEQVVKRYGAGGVARALAARAYLNWKDASTRTTLMQLHEQHLDAKSRMVRSVRDPDPQADIVAAALAMRTGKECLFTFSSTGHVRVWDYAASGAREPLDHWPPSTNAAPIGLLVVLSPEGVSSLVAAFEDGMLSVHSAETGVARRVWTSLEGGRLSSIRRADDGHVVAMIRTPSGATRVQLLDLFRSDKPIRNRITCPGPIHDAWRHEGDHLVVAYDETAVIDGIERTVHTIVHQGPDGQLGVWRGSQLAGGPSRWTYFKNRVVWIEADRGEGYRLRMVSVPHTVDMTGVDAGMLVFDRPVEPQAGSLPRVLENPADDRSFVLAGSSAAIWNQAGPGTSLSPVHYLDRFEPNVACWHRSLPGSADGALVVARWHPDRLVVENVGPTIEKDVLEEAARTEVRDGQAVDVPAKYETVSYNTFAGDTISTPAPIAAVLLSAAGRSVLVIGRDGVLRVYERSSYRGTAVEARFRIERMWLDPNGERLLSYRLDDEEETDESGLIPPPPPDTTSIVIDDPLSDAVRSSVCLTMPGGHVIPLALGGADTIELRDVAFGPKSLSLCRVGSLDRILFEGGPRSPRLAASYRPSSAEFLTLHVMEGDRTHLVYDAHRRAVHMLDVLPSAGDDVGMSLRAEARLPALLEHHSVLDARFVGEIDEAALLFLKLSDLPRFIPYGEIGRHLPASWQALVRVDPATAEIRLLRLTREPIIDLRVIEIEGQRVLRQTQYRRVDDLSIEDGRLVRCDSYECADSNRQILAAAGVGEHLEVWEFDRTTEDVVIVDRLGKQVRRFPLAARLAPGARDEQVGSPDDPCEAAAPAPPKGDAEPAPEASPEASSQSEVETPHRLPSTSAAVLAREIEAAHGVRLSVRGVVSARGDVIVAMVDGFAGVYRRSGDLICWFDPGDVLVDPDACGTTTPRAWAVDPQGSWLCLPSPDQRRATRLELREDRLRAMAEELVRQYPLSRRDLQRFGLDPDTSEIPTPVGQK